MKTYYIGYTYGKEYLKKVGDNYKLFVSSENHIYEIIREHTLIEEGIEAKYENRKQEFREEDREVERQYSVFQINYDFYLLPTGRCVAINEIQGAERIIRTLFNIRGSEYVNLKNCFNKYLGHLPFQHIEDFKPFEICSAGHSEAITNSTGKRLFELDIEQYKANKQRFILENPNYEEDTERLFKANIGHLALFWNVNSVNVLKDNFCRKTAAISKLNRKINSKIKKLKL